MYGQVLNPSGDAYVVPGNSTNFGAVPTVTVGSSNSYGLLQFDLSQLPGGVTGSQVQKATLTIFIDRIISAGTFNLDTVSTSTPWTESTVNGNTVIGPQTSVATLVPVNTAGTFVTVDATGAVQGWLNGTYVNNGFLVIANGSTSFQFDAKENTATSHPPTLTITLLPASVEFVPSSGPHVFPTVPIIVAGTVTLSGGAAPVIFSSSFTSTSTYACTVTVTAASPTSTTAYVTNLSTHAIGIQSSGGTGGETFHYICVGY
jgi:hypothetical protein